MPVDASPDSPVKLLRVAVTLSLVLIVAVGRGATQQPAPVSPTVPVPALPNRLILAPATLHPKLSHLMKSLNVPDRGKDHENGAESPDASVEGPELTLGECIAVAVDRQPALRAMRASQEATGAGQQALNNIGRLGALVSPDLPIRKEQAQRGVLAAAADVQKLHNEIVHDVTRMYYTVVYARQQERFAAEVVAQVLLFAEVGEALLKSPAPGEMTVSKLRFMQIGLSKARERLATARNGARQATAGLREAMGVDDKSFPFQVKDRELPIMAQNIPLTKDQIVDMALCRRPELALAAAAADAFRLEVYAQAKVPFRRSVPTLASGSDIHSRILPPGSRDPNSPYRPEPIAPEMPPQVVGSKADRVARTMAYSHRADAVYDKARNLMILEAETTFFQFELAAERVKHAREGFTAGKDLMDRIREGFDNPKAAKEQLLLGYAQAAEAQATYVEAAFQYLLALAALERVTAGGVRPAFPGR